MATGLPSRIFRSRLLLQARRVHTSSLIRSRPSLYNHQEASLKGNQLRWLSYYRPQGLTVHQSGMQLRYLAMLGVAYGTATAIVYFLVLPKNPEHPPLRSDAPPPSSSSPTNSSVLDNDPRTRALVPTGTSTIPFFPQAITLPSTPAESSQSFHPSTPGTSGALPAGIPNAPSTTTYQLLGLGIRTVTFLGIQVYVVGLYVAASDLSALQERMVHAISGNESATTLIGQEKESLVKQLSDPEASERIWKQVLNESGIRSVIRIVPTRQTDYGHLKEGWIRGLTARGVGKGFEDKAEWEDRIKEFRGILGGRGKLGKGKAMLLGRGAEGGLSVWAEAQGEKNKDDEQIQKDAVKKQKDGKDDGEGDRSMEYLGGVLDPRVGNLVWMGYVAGGNVASEGARKSVVEGVKELVERPIGTVETMVV